MSPQSVLKLESVYPLYDGGGQVPLKKDRSIRQKIYTINLFPSLPQRDLWPWTKVTIHWGKGNNLTFRGILNIGSDLITDSRKCYCGPPIRVAVVCHVINGV